MDLNSSSSIPTLCLIYSGDCLYLSNSIFQLAFHAMAGDLATIVPKRFAHLPNTRQKILTDPSVSQVLGLVWVHGNPVLPMTNAATKLIREALESGALEEISFLGE